MFITRSHLLLVSVALILGFTFVAQSTGMAHLGPHSFNAARFLLGALSLLPLWFILGDRSLPHGRALLINGGLAGVILFGGFTFQLVGLLYTSVGNAGFITGMYIVFVPVAGLLLGRSSRPSTWAGILLAVIGLYVLTIEPGAEINRGDFLELIGALFWAAHVIVIGGLSRRFDAIGLSITQFAVATLLAGVCAFWFESPTLPAFKLAWLPLLYAGIASSAIACTLQVIAQRKIEPTATAMILATEAAFAALGGWWLLDEPMGVKELIGCALMLAGMMISQLPKRSPSLQLQQG